MEIRNKHNGFLFYVWEKSTRYFWEWGWVGPQLFRVQSEKEKYVKFIVAFHFTIIKKQTDCGAQICFHSKVLMFFHGDKPDRT
jgi:hypothetical protein